MTRNLAELQVEERVRFDPSKLEALCHELGEEGAERVIAHGFEQIALKVARIKAFAQAGAIDELLKVSRSLARVARRIGMETLAEVAHDVRRSASRGDPVALAATLARLGRIGDHSVNAIWTLEDISI